MRTHYAWAFVMCAAVCGSCSKEDRSPVASQPSATTPATGPASGAAASRPARRYEPLSDELVAYKAEPPSARSRWALIQLSLAANAYDDAAKEYALLKEQFPKDVLLLKSCGLQLVQAFLMSSPPNVEQARAVLAHLRAIDTKGAANRLVDECVFWNCVAWLADGSKLLTSDEQPFASALSEWRQDLEQGCEAYGNIEPLVHAFDGLANSIEPMNAIVAGRLERIAVVIQAEYGWRSVAELRAMQERRVRILAKAGKMDEAVCECPALLALASQDARAFPLVIDMVARTLTAAGRDADSIRKLSDLQQHGPNGADGLAGTPDDPGPVTLCGKRRDISDMWKLDLAPTTVPASDSPLSIDRAIRDGMMKLVAGNGAEALTHFKGVTRSGAIGLDRQRTLIMDALGVAQALVDGHPFKCEQPAWELCAGADRSVPAQVWRYEAVQSIEQQERLVNQFIEDGRLELALAHCRAMADQARSLARVHTAVDLAWTACQTKAKSEPADSPLSQFSQFGKSLSNPEARVYRTRLCAEALRRSGQEAAALAEVETLKDMWSDAVRDPALILLHVSGLVGAGRSAEALPEARQLCERADLPPEIRWRAQLVLGIAYVQEGRPGEAREALRRLIDEGADRDYLGRAVSVLRKIQM